MCLHRWFPQASDHNSPRDVCCTAGKQCDSELHCVQQQWFTNDHSLAEGWGGAVWCRSGKLCPVPRGRADLYHCASPPQCELHRWGALPVCGLQSLWFQLLQQGQAYCQWWGCVISLNECDQPVLFLFVCFLGGFCASCSLTLFRLWVAGFANSLQYICMKLILVYSLFVK